MDAIAIRNLRKSFGGHDVLHDINLDVEPGEFTVLLGPSGCGKSTLLNAIAGLEEVNGGSISIGGRDVTRTDPAKRGIAMVFQSYALYPTMSVRNNMSFGLRVKRLPRAEIAERVQRAASMLQLDALMDRKPSQLSGGQRQRVAIGRALVQNARVFLFDEPLSNLDAKLRTEMRIEIKRLHQELQSTIVYVTHDQIEAMTLASRIAVMRGGQVEQYATPDMLYEQPQTLFVAGFVGSPAMNFIPAELRAGCAVFAGGSLALGGYQFAAVPPQGSEIVLGVRPEHVTITGSGGMPATLLFIEPMGADTLCWFDVKGQRISARLTPQAARGLSGSVHLRFEPDRLSLFAAGTGHRL